MKQTHQKFKLKIQYRQNEAADDYLRLNSGDSMTKDTLDISKFQLNRNENIK